jgi:hypothetical protein
LYSSDISDLIIAEDFEKNIGSRTGLEMVDVSLMDDIF